MMCEVCKLAGKSIRNKYLPALVTPDEYAQAMHRLCPFPKTCTCQHRRGSFDATSVQAKEA